MQVSIPERNKENIITLLNKLSYLSDIRHLKSRYMHIAIKSLQICAWILNHQHI